MQIHSVGIDLGKTTFHLVALEAAGKALAEEVHTEAVADSAVYVRQVRSSCEIRK